MRTIGIVLAVAVALGAARVHGQQPQGEIKGSASVHTEASLAASVASAALVLPARATGSALFAGKLADAPPAAARVPVVIFVHGSSGLGLAAIGEWQRWLASLGVASVAPDSFALPDRITYTSPVDKATYEKIHAMRAAEIDAALAAVKRQPWADPARIVLAGTSEGSVAVARYAGGGISGRIVYAWSCEPNYFVTQPRNGFGPDEPVLNVISAVDPFFSPSNPWLGNPSARGHCAEALRGDKNAVIVLIPGAPHTLINLPAARNATAAFVADVLKP
ncbi:MAG TPA: dienelactone hydrolase family protein [Casimicrobiaceae bacterium]|nr:dienelactone hydrolase family protein [Casimicrobiaceae bacterium]